MGQAVRDTGKERHVGIVIVAHGHLADALLAAARHVLGAVEQVRTVSIDADYDKVAKAAEIRTAAAEVDTGAGVVVVVDLHGSSPANLCQAIADQGPRHILTGANLPMLIKLAQSRHLPLESAVEAALLAGRKYIDGRDLAPREEAR